MNSSAPSLFPVIIRSFITLYMMLIGRRSADSFSILWSSCKSGATKSMHKPIPASFQHRAPAGALFFYTYMLITMLKTKHLEISFQHSRARPKSFQHFQHKKVSGSLYGRKFSTISTRKFSTISTLSTIVDKILKTKKFLKLRYLIMFFI